MKGLLILIFSKENRLHDTLDARCITYYQSSRKVNIELASIRNLIDRKCKELFNICIKLTFILVLNNLKLLRHSAPQSLLCLRASDKQFETNLRQNSIVSV